MLDINVHKRYRSKRRQVDIGCVARIEDSMTTAFYGKSGIGKSAVLRMIAGLEPPDSGKIVFNGVTWFSSDDKINLPIAKRKLGFVFQDYNLFPNMTVEQNLKYASEKGDINVTIKQILNVTGLNSLLKSYPHELSGGQNQRVAIVRALSQAPELLLLDEPFSALDDEAIHDLIEQIKTIQQDFNMMIIVISHRKDVIFEMAQSVVYLKPQGNVEQGNPKEILKRSFR